MEQDLKDELRGGAGVLGMLMFKETNKQNLWLNKDVFNHAQYLRKN